MKNTILFSLLFLMMFCNHAVFAQSENRFKWEIYKEEKVGHDSAIWERDQDSLICVSFKKDSGVRTMLKTNNQSVGKLGIYESEISHESLTSLRKTFQESLTPEQKERLLQSKKSPIVLLFVIGIDGKIATIRYSISKECRDWFSSEGLYKASCEIKKKISFAAPSRYGLDSFSYSISARSF